MTTRPLTTVLSGIGSLLVLAALLAGIPAALLLLAGNPFPSGDELGRALTTPDYGGAFLMGTVLPLIAWVAWATFALGFLVELPAQLRRLPSPSLPGLGRQQKWAAGLIVAVVVMITGFSSIAQPASASAPGFDQAPVSVAQEAAPASAPAAVTEVTPAVGVAPAVAAAPTYEVVDGDSLWRIAEQHLGAGERFLEIAQLNYGGSQADGHSLTADHWLNSGWVLTLPADAAVPAADTADGAALLGTADHVVVAGDTLWDIAATAYGDGDRYSEIFSASEAVVQPGGGSITDPNLIHPGQTVLVPGSVAVPAVPTAVSAEASSDTKMATASVGATSLDPGGASAAGAAEVADAAGAEAATQARAFVEPVSLGTTGGIGGLLAAALVGILGIRRLRQRRLRASGEQISLPGDASSALESELRSVQDRRARRNLERVLDLLAAASPTLPPLVRVSLTENLITLYLAGPCALGAPFVAVTDEPLNRAFSVDPAELPEADARGAAGYPALVTVGRDCGGALVLLNLTQIGLLAVTGPTELTGPAVDALAAEIATNSAPGARVTLVGIAEGLPIALKTGTVRHLGPDAALAALRTRAEVDSQPETEVLILSDSGLQGDARRELLALRGGGFAIVDCAPGTPADARHGEWVLGIDSHSQATLAPLGLDLVPQLVDAQETTHILDLLDVADRPAERMVPLPAAITAALVGDAAFIGDAPVLAPYVRLLGPAAVTGAKGTAPEPGNEWAARAVELVAFLTLNRTASAVEVHEALWPTEIPTGVRAQHNRNALMKHTRAWLGSDDEGALFLPLVGLDDRRLHAGVRSDWDDFVALVGPDVTVTSTTDLARAIRLVTGAPLASRDPTRFAWAERMREVMLAAIGDAAHELATRALVVDDAATVSEPGPPLDEAFWREAMPAGQDSADAAAFGRTMRALERQLRQLDPPRVAADAVPATVRSHG
ncbi:LysM peptidoglycan-binding domain-containing protein [Cryobacterium melibiosiphilum]|nr:LysM peptidoglycan-binding domain-containing protein [Cryobacterium melibiosiphilum]